MAWAYLIFAGVFEIGWPIGLKLGGTESVSRLLWIGFAVGCMVASGVLLLFVGGLIFLNRLTWLSGKLGFLNRFAL